MMDSPRRPDDVKASGRRRRTGISSVIVVNGPEAFVPLHDFGVLNRPEIGDRRLGFRDIPVIDVVAHVAAGADQICNPAAVEIGWSGLEVDLVSDCGL